MSDKGAPTAEALQTALHHAVDLGDEYLHERDEARADRDRLAAEVARLTAEGKELQADRDTLNEALHRARAAIDSNHEDIVYDIIDLKEELAEARRRLGLAEAWLEAQDKLHKCGGKMALSRDGTFKDTVKARDDAREAFRASLPAKPSGGEP